MDCRYPAIPFILPLEGRVPVGVKEGVGDAVGDAVGVEVNGEGGNGVGV